MLGKLLYWSTQATLALIAATMFAALVLPPDAAGGLWVFLHLADATLLALAGTLTVFGVWAVDRLTDRTVVNLRSR